MIYYAIMGCGAVNEPGLSVGQLSSANKQPEVHLLREGNKSRELTLDGPTFTLTSLA